MFKGLPPQFVKSLENITGFEPDSFCRLHESGEKITSVRINPAKLPFIPFDVSEHIPWLENGYYLPERPSFTLDPIFHGGGYYVQEASSMFLETALKQTVNLNIPLMVLDLCAAPGGKSTLIQSVISGDSVLVSNEILKSRANILAENITKWGAANVVVTNNAPGDFNKLAGFFDVIIVDAPCSGSGLFRKDENAIKEWSLDNVTMCSNRQKSILSDALVALKPGGVLVYSTCSYSYEEDECITDWLIESGYENLKLEIPASWNIVESITPARGYGYRFYPDKLKGEGFYLSVFKKFGDATFQKEHQKQTIKLLTPKEDQYVRPWVNEDDICLMKWKDDILALPSSLIGRLPELQHALYIIKAGVKAGTLIRDELIPHHELALSSILSDKVPSVELSYENALQYLRKKDFQADIKNKGWMVVRYNGIALGWIKALANRLNNYYPKEWRILNM